MKITVRHADRDGGAVTSVLSFEAGEVVAIGGKIFYTDTDSVITNVNLPSSSELGAMKDEYPGEELAYHAVQPKVYVIEKMSLPPSDPKRTKVTMKGFPVAMRTTENLARLEAGEVLKFLPNGERWMRLEKIRSLARVGFRRPPRMNPVEKSFKSKYDKRVSLPGGGTRSIVLNEPVGGYIEGFDEELDQAAE